MHQHKQTNTQSGFTLIELLIVVGIVAILMAVAYPSYRTFIQRSHAAHAGRGVVHVRDGQAGTPTQRGNPAGGRDQQ